MSWKSALFRLVGKEPEAVVVSFASGDLERCRKMAAEVRDLEPKRRHFLICLGQGIEVPGVATIVVSTQDPFLESRHSLRQYRIGLAPVLFDGSPHPLHKVAALLAPRKIIAFNIRLERHHISLWSPIASALFLNGVELDRIWLRPWSNGDGYRSTKYVTLEGRPWRKGRRRIGILSPYFPWPLSHGGAVRIYHLLREAAKEFDIVLYAFGEPDAASPILEFVSLAYVMELPRYRKPRWASLAPPEVCEYESPVLRKLLETSRIELGLSLLQVEYTQLAQYSGDVLVEHDVTFDLWDQVAHREQSPSAKWNVWRWRHFEQRAVRRFPYVVTMSEKDSGTLAVSNCHVIPNGVDLSRFIPTLEMAGHRVLFIGSFRHFPNILAFRYFVQQIWPLVRRQFPDAEFTVVAGPQPELYWRNHTADQFPQQVNGIQILGFVADVVSLYEQANVVVAPTLVSAGTNLKVLEAMAMRRAIVATPSGCQGLNLENAASVWIAETPLAFADGVNTLLAHSEFRAKLAQNAYRIAHQNFDWVQIGRRQQSLWEEKIGPLFTVRAGTAADLDRVQEIQKQTPEAAQWPPLSYLCEHFFIVESTFPKIELAGYGVWREVTTGEWELLNMAVCHSFRRRGVASRLLAKLMENQPKAVFLEVRESNDSARRLYASHQFVEVGLRKNYYGNPIENAIVMRL